MAGNRILAAGLLSIGIAAAGTMVSLDAQALKTMPRTPDGHPDLQGTYNVATITPIDRPAEFGNRQNLTKEEAAKLENAEAQRTEKLAEPDQPADQRTAPAVGGEKRNPNATYLERVFEGGGGVVGGYNGFWIAPGSQVVTVNGEKRTSIVVDPPNGQVPRMKPEASRRNAEYNRRAVRPDAGEDAAANGPASAFDDPE